MVCLFLCSCANNKYGLETLSDTLFCDYNAKIDYTFKTQSGELSGKASVTKGDTVKIEVESPEPYSGLCAVSDEGGNPSVITISYYGIKSDMPDNMLPKLNLAMRIFSAEAQTEIFELKNDSIVETRQIDTEDFGFSDTSVIIPRTAEFYIDTYKCLITYDSVTGTPLYLSAQCDDFSLEIVYKEFNLQTD